MTQVNVRLNESSVVHVEYKLLQILFLNIKSKAAAWYFGTKLANI